jgi:hypothetical protein
MPNGGQDFDKAKPKGAASPAEKKIEGKYVMLCGIFGGRTDGDKPVPPPLPAKDEKDRLGKCVLFDASTPGVSNIVPGELQASRRVNKVDPITAVKQWKYSPALLNGKAVPFMTYASIDFTFNKDGSPKIITCAP